MWVLLCRYQAGFSDPRRVTLKWSHKDFSKKRSESRKGELHSAPPRVFESEDLSSRPRSILKGLAETAVEDTVRTGKILEDRFSGFQMVGSESLYETA